MKKFYCIACLLTTMLLAAAFSTFAQDDPDVPVRNGNLYEDDRPLPPRGLAKENLFTGGNFQLGGGSGYFTFGLSPMLGYRFNKYVDAGVLFNYSYQSGRDVYYNDYKYRYNMFGPGIFTRIYPVSFLFAQAQLEQNFIRGKEYSDGKWYRIPSTAAYNPTSFLVGGGYAGGRTAHNNTFYYISLLFDVMKNANSPYRYSDGKLKPVINAGFNIALFQRRDRNLYRE